MKKIFTTLMIFLFSTTSFGLSPLPLFGIIPNGGPLTIMADSGKRIVMMDSSIVGMTGEEFLLRREANPLLKVLIERLNNAEKGRRCTTNIAAVGQDPQFESLRYPQEGDRLGPLVVFQSEIQEHVIRCFWN